MINYLKNVTKIQLNAPNNKLVAIKVVTISNMEFALLNVQNIKVIFHYTIFHYFSTIFFFLVFNSKLYICENCPNSCQVG